MDVVRSTIERWGDTKSIAHADMGMRTHLSTVLLRAFGLLCDSEYAYKAHKVAKDWIMMELLTGVQSHLASPIVEVRKYACMCVACMCDVCVFYNEYPRLSCI